MTCDYHAGQTHGHEAEELRRGIEDILKNTDWKDIRSELQRLLDETDARDSLAYLEDRDRQLATMTAARDEACEIAEQAVVELKWPGTARIAELRKVGDK